MNGNAEERSKKILRLRQEIENLREKNLFLYSRIEDMDNWFDDSLDAINDVLGYSTEYETDSQYSTNSYLSEDYSETSPEDSEDGQFIDESEEEDYAPRKNTSKNTLKAKIQIPPNPIKISEQIAKMKQQMPMKVPIQTISPIVYSNAMPFPTISYQTLQKLTPQQVHLYQNELQKSQVQRQVDMNQMILNQKMQQMLEISKTKQNTFNQTNLSTVPTQTSSAPVKTQKSPSSSHYSNDDISDIATKMLINGFGYKLDPTTNNITKESPSPEKEKPKPKPKGVVYQISSSRAAIKSNINTVIQSSCEKLFEPNILPGKQLPPPSPEIIARYKEMRQIIKNDIEIKQQIAKNSIV